MIKTMGKSSSYILADFPHFILSIFFYFERQSVVFVSDWQRGLSSLAGLFGFVLSLSIFFFFCFDKILAVLRGTYLSLYMSICISD